MVHYKGIPNVRLKAYIDRSGRLYNNTIGISDGGLFIPSFSGIDPAVIKVYPKAVNTTTYSGSLEVTNSGIRIQPWKPGDGGYVIEIERQEAPDGDEVIRIRKRYPEDGEFVDDADFSITSSGVLIRSTDETVSIPVFESEDRFMERAPLQVTKSGILLYGEGSVICDGSGFFDANCLCLVTGTCFNCDSAIVASYMGPKWTEPPDPIVLWSIVTPPGETYHLATFSGTANKNFFWMSARTSAASDAVGKI